jgi:hypothetical protein
LYVYYCNYQYTVRAGQRVRATRFASYSVCSEQLGGEHAHESVLPPSRLRRRLLPCQCTQAFDRASLLVCVEGPSCVASAAVPTVHIHMCTGAPYWGSPKCIQSCLISTPIIQLRELLADDLLFSLHDCPTVRRVCTVHLLI